MLSAAGIRTGVAVAPVIPGLNDSDIPKVLARAREAGAERAFLTLLRLPAETPPVFEQRLAEAFPDRAARVFSNLEQMRGGKRNDSRFGSRMEGVGPALAGDREPLRGRVPPPRLEPPTARRTRTRARSGGPPRRRRASSTGP